MQVDSTRLRDVRDKAKRPTGPATRWPSMPVRGRRGSGWPWPPVTRSSVLDAAEVRDGNVAVRTALIRFRRVVQDRRVGSERAGESGPAHARPKRLQRMRERVGGRGAFEAAVRHA